MRGAFTRAAGTAIIESVCGRTLLRALLPEGGSGMPETVRRGYAPGDAREFGEKAFPLLRRAQRDIFYLVSRGYALERAVTFVGDRFQFSARQRMALARATCSRGSLLGRRRRECGGDLAGKTLLVDGFNLIIPLEIALSRSTLILCMDGAVRDLAGLHGSYRLIDKTDRAIRLAGDELAALGVAGARFYLDAPVSNAGRLRQRILALLKDAPFAAEAVLSDHVDGMLLGREFVATGDSAILDRCVSWVNLTARILRRRMPGYPLIDLSLPDALEWMPA